MRILDEMREIARLIDRDLVNKAPCFNCDHDDVTYDQDCNRMWCNHCNDWAHIRRDYDRPVQGGTKNSGTGSITPAQDYTHFSDVPSGWGK